MPDKQHKVTYAADTNSVVYSFPASDFNATVQALIKANKDYAPLMVSTLSKYIRELSKNLMELDGKAGSVCQFIKKHTRRIRQSAGRQVLKPILCESLRTWMNGKKK